MWNYRSVSRREFEKRKAFVAQSMLKLGCEAVEIALPYKQKTISCGKSEETWISKQPIYKFKSGFYRIDEVLFPEKPFIVLEYSDTLEEVKMNIMEDLEPFPYDLSDEKIRKEIEYSLGIEPYPQDKDT